MSIFSTLLNKLKGKNSETEVIEEDDLTVFLDSDSKVGLDFRG
jgi:hypothetical protein